MPAAFGTSRVSPGMSNSNCLDVRTAPCHTDKTLSVFGDHRKPQEVARLLDETVLLYLRLTAFAGQLYGEGHLSGPRRTVLVGLARTGPQTVAQMARTRAQSRQRFQPLVNALVADGLVKTRPNPAHKQSPLIELTARGRRAVARIHRIESRGRARLQLAASTRRIKDAVAVMRDVRAGIEREMGMTPERIET